MQMWTLPGISVEECMSKLAFLLRLVKGAKQLSSLVIVANKKVIMDAHC
jgi:hypothetical protein